MEEYFPCFVIYEVFFMKNLGKITDAKDITTKEYVDKIPYGVCGTAAATAAKTVTLDRTVALETGVVIYVKFTYINSVANPTLDVNTLGAKPIIRYGTTAAGTNGNTSWFAGNIVSLVYDGTNWVLVDWASKENTNTVPQVQCETAAATAAKGGSCTNFSLATNSFVMVNLRYSNSSASAITMNINSTGAKPIYINGTASSATNYTLPAGSYLVFYNGTNYYFRTDGKITGSITGDAATVNGKTVAVNVPSGAVFTDTHRPIQMNGTEILGNNTTALNLKAGSNVSLTNSSGTVTIAATDTTYSDATTSASGLMSSGDKTKLNGIATGAEVNQNAFSNVKVGSTTVAADSKTDTLELVAGSNVTLTPDATNDKVTIAATDTTYSDATTSASGLMSSGDKTKLNGIATGAEVNQNAFSNVKVGSTTVAADAKTDTLELAAGTNITLTPDATNDKVTIASVDTKNTAGSTDTSSKIFLVGATSQAANPQTYSDNQVYATNGQLDANSVRIAEAVSLVYDSTNKCLNFNFS